MKKHIGVANFKRALIAMFGTALFASSCEKVVDFKGNEPSPKLVVDVAAGPNKGQKWVYGHSGFEENTHIIGVTEAVFLFGDRKPGPVKDPVLSVSLNGVDIPVETSTNWNTGTVYRHFRTPLVAGDRLEFSAETPTHGRVTASDVVPRAAVIREVRTEWFSKENHEPCLRTLVTIADPAGERNYYAVKMYRVDHILAKTEKWDPETGVFVPEITRYDVEEECTAYTDQEVLFNNTDGVWLDTETWGQISDDLIDGREYTLNLYTSFRPDGLGFDFVPPEEEEYGDWVLGQSVRVEILTLSEELFKHRRSQDIYDLGDTTSEPVRIYSNVAGGYGIFGAYNTASQTVLLPTPEIPDTPDLPDIPYTR